MKVLRQGSFLGVCFSDRVGTGYGISVKGVIVRTTTGLKSHDFLVHGYSGCIGYIQQLYHTGVAKLVFKVAVLHFSMEALMGWRGVWGKR